MQAATLSSLAVPDAAARAAMLLDDAGEWPSFGRPVPARDGRWESFLAIEGIHCAGCALTIEQALTGLPGVREVQVNGATASARILWDCAAGRPSQWLGALQRAGYRGLPAADHLLAAERRQAQRLLLWRWLVAGFCMMQVMMYAWPAYVAGEGEMTPDVALLLRWAAWLLTLPVLLFSCRPFFSSGWRDLRHGRVGMDVPVALGILIAFAASSAATFDPRGPLGSEVWYDSITMFVFFLLSGRLLEQRLHDRTAGALEALLRRLPETVERVLADGSSERVPVRRIAAGDRIRVHAGETFPADGLVLEGDTQVDEALLTGEATPVPRGAGEAVIAGSGNLRATVLVAASCVGAATRYGQIVGLMESAAHGKPAIARLADRVAMPFLAAVVLAAAAAAWWWWPQGAGHAIGVAVAVLIVTCPCALSLASPAATLAAAGALAGRGILVRRMEALEAAAGVDVVVFDKTGTLTTDRIGVHALRTRQGCTQAQALALAGALARHSLHPASRALAAAAPAEPALLLREVAEHAGQGVQGVLPAALGWARGRVRLGSAAFCDLPEALEAGAAQVHLRDADGWLASFDLDETLRPGTLAATGALRRLGLQLEVLSGDRDGAVQRLASRAGIARALGRQAPQDKLDHVARLQQGGRRVAMVGDGMNDGPVLARADVSIAVGDAVPVAQARSDFIIQGGSQLEGVAVVLRQARRTRTVVRQNLAWAVAYNAACVPLAAAGLMPPWLAGLGMACSSLFVVLNAARLARVPQA